MRNELAYTAQPIVIVEAPGFSPSSRGIKAGTTEELRENPEKIDAHRLAPWIVLRQLSYRTQGSLPVDSTAHSGLGPPRSLNSQENAHRYAKRPMMEAILQLKFKLTI